MQTKKNSISVTLYRKVEAYAMHACIGNIESTCDTKKKGQQTDISLILKVAAHAHIIYCPRDQILISGCTSLVLFGPELGILCAVVLIDQ